MSKSTTVLIVCIVLVLGIGGFLFYRGFRFGRLPGALSPGQKMQQLVPVTTGKTTASKEKVYRQTIDIDARSFFFNPDVFLVKKGQKVTVRVHAYGDHTFTIDELNVNEKTPDGKVTTIEFTPKKEGAYHYYCSKPGHKEAGMVGTMIAE